MEKVEKRVFEVELANGETVKVSTRKPTNQEIEASDMEYSRAFTNALIAGLYPQETLIAIFREKGIWSEAKDDAIRAQTGLVSVIETSLEEAAAEKKNEIAEELKEERNKLFEMRQSRSSYLSHSAEAKAANAQRDSTVAQVTENAKGVRVWRSLEDFLRETDSNLIFRATYEYVTFENGLPSDFMSKLPENQVATVEEKPADGMITIEGA